MSRLPVRIMDEAGVVEAVSWALSEGWQPGLTDAVPFHSADPEGFFHSKDGERTVATIAVTRASKDFAFIGLYIVDPVDRGTGRGRQLWDDVLERFEGVSLGLDSVPEQVAIYASDGFESAHGNARYSGQRLPAPEAEIELAEAGSVDFDRLTSYDAAHFFGPRPKFLRPWIRGEGREAVVALDGGEITGFAASRRTSAGHRIGPVFADDPAIARNLILELAARAKSRVAIDLPQSNAAAVDLVTDLGMSRSFETTRMYRGKAPELPLDRIFGITSLELG